MDFFQNYLIFIQFTKFAKTNLLVSKHVAKTPIHKALYSVFRKSQYFLAGMPSKFTKFKISFLKIFKHLESQKETKFALQLQKISKQPDIKYKI